MTSTLVVLQVESKLVGILRMRTALMLFCCCMVLRKVACQHKNGSAPSNPSSITVGALLDLDSLIGKVARIAIEAAVNDVNANSSILNGTKLNILFQDTGDREVLGISKALQLVKRHVIAIIGPQYSGIAHVICDIANQFQVPLLSFSATDPTLSLSQNNYFIRMTQNDYFQMRAVADAIIYYGWKEIVAIFVDDDHGTHGVSVLGDALMLKQGKVTHKASLPRNATENEVQNLLSALRLIRSRIYVVHMDAITGLLVLSMAKRLGMMECGSAWIATDWLSTVMDSYNLSQPEMLGALQGVVYFRYHILNTDKKRQFESAWGGLLKGYNDSIGLNAYALFAYDTVWLTAYAASKFLRDGGMLDHCPGFRESVSRVFELSGLHVFDGGRLLLEKMLETSFVGLTGLVQFDSEKNLVHPAYEIVNIVGAKQKKVGYWSSFVGLSDVPPEVFYLVPTSRTSYSQHLHRVMWPGETARIPRGWVFPIKGMPLRVGVPYRVTYRDFVSKGKNQKDAKGFCIDVFVAAISLLPYPVQCQFILFGNGIDNPVYDDLVNEVVKGNFDAIVGDISIDKNRARVVDFTQPFIETSLAIVAPIQSYSSAWFFVKPFTLKMWMVTCAFSIFVGIIVWLFEHRINTGFQGPPQYQLGTMVWFGLSTMFLSHRKQSLLPFCDLLSVGSSLCIFLLNRTFFAVRDIAGENAMSNLGRVVLVLWLFVVMIITSSYVASLTSSITVGKLPLHIEGIDSLITSNEPVGIQAGSFIRKYLIEELGIAEHRLAEFDRPEDYVAALKHGPLAGGVAAIIDELPYMQLFVSGTGCKFKIVGQMIMRSGWGFAFKQGSPLVLDVSTGILKLSEDDVLQNIHDKWFSRGSCYIQMANPDMSQLTLGSFWGIFLVCGVACFIAVLIFLLRLRCLFRG